MKRVHVSSVANAGSDERVEFKGKLHTRSMQQGQCVANVKSIVVPQQFRNSSAQMWVSAQASNAQEYEMVTPTSDGDISKQGGMHINTLDRIVFLRNPVTGYTYWWKHYATAGNHKQFFLKNSADTSETLGVVGENAFTKIRPSKWASDEEALDNINSALRCAIMNSYQNNSLTSARMTEVPKDSNLDPFTLNAPSPGITYALDFYFFSNAAQTVELTVKFKAQNKRDVFTAQASPVDLITHFCRLGTFTMEAKKWYRICPYDVYDKIEETTSSTSLTNSQIATAYHSAKEVRKDGFFRSETDIYGSPTSRMDIYQNISVIDKKPVAGTSTEVDAFDGALYVVEYMGQSDTTTQQSRYLPEIPQLQKVMSPSGPLVDLRLDRAVHNYNIVFNDTMKYRLQLSNDTFVADSQRYPGESVPLDLSGTVPGFIIGDQDLMKLIDVRRSRVYPIFNDVYDISIQKGDEVGRVKVKRGKTAHATSDIVHFRQSGSTMPYPENELIGGESKVDMGSNQLDQSGFITLHNPLTLVDERVPMLNKLQGNVVSTIDMDLVNAAP